MTTMSSPENWEADIVLSDGGIAHLRAIRGDDRPRMLDFYTGVSPESKYLRFFATHPELNDGDLARLIDVDHHSAVTLVVTVRDEIIATAHYGIVPSLLPARVGEVSFLVQDEHQGRGVANILLEHLAQVGRECGIERFFAEMLTNNRVMIQVFIKAGYAVKPELEDGYVVVDFPIDPTDASRLVMEERERKAEANAIRRILYPANIALMGQAPQIGVELPQLDELSGDVDLVVAQYDAQTLVQTMVAAARRKANGVLFLAPSFSPMLSEEAVHHFVSTARSHGLRALGPAALGLINTHPDAPLNISPAPTPRSGPIGLFTQSAGVATITLSQAIHRGAGISSFIASGYFADVTANDVIQFWADDQRTRICLLSLDAVGNPRKFFRVLRRLALEKPVVIFTPSRALLSARNHGMSAGPEALDQVVRQAGAMVVSRRNTMFDIAQILARQPAPRGRRVLLLSNSQGLSEQMKQAARRFALIPDVRTVEDMVAAAQEALQDPHVDAVVTAVVEVKDPLFEAVYEGLSGLAVDSRIPLIGVFVGFRSPDVDYSAPEGFGQLPVSDNYAEMLEALSIIIHNEDARVMARPTSEDEIFQGDLKAARRIVADFLREFPEGGWVSDAQCHQLLGSYGIFLTRYRAVGSVEEAVAAGEDAGWNVVLKATCDAARGRPELSTIVRDIQDAESMQRAWGALATAGINLGLSMDGDVAPLLPVVQRMVRPGPSLTVRALEDPVLGPMISVGITGMASDLLGDLSWRVPPLRRHDAQVMLSQLRAAPLLHGYRGLPSASFEPLKDLLMRIGRLKDDLPAVVDVELTPIIAGSDTTDVLGARIRIVPSPGERDRLARTAS